MHRTQALSMSTALVAVLVAGCAAPGSTVQSTAPTKVAAPSGVASLAKACPTERERLKQPRPTSFGTPVNTARAEALAQAIDPKGHQEFADVYGTLIVDFPPGRVALCVTDPARGELMAQAAKKRDPSIDLTRLDLYRCQYSQQALDKVIDKMVRAGTTVAGFPVYSWSPAQDSSGIQVASTQGAVDSRAVHAALAAIAAGIPVTVVKGEPTKAL